MKARNFAYVKAKSIPHAIELLTQYDGGAVILAGGQSLLAGLNLRLSAPEILIDITGLEELKGISVQDGVVRIGALTRHVEVLRSDVIKEQLPLISEAIKWVAHAGIRNRGTIGGSVAYADPSAEPPACVVALDATIVLQGPQGRRPIKARDFYDGLFSTALQPDEIITEFLIPVQRPGNLWAFLELSRRHGDFAMAGVAIVTKNDSAGVVEDASVVYFGCTDYPALAITTGMAICGTAISDARLEAIDIAVPQDLQLEDTPGYRADTKLRFARALTRRALRRMGAAGPDHTRGLDHADASARSRGTTNDHI
jgi:carbon-monoxide dehydrogenase medium subunit